MALSKAEKAAYQDYIREYKTSIDEAGKRIKDSETKKKKMPAIANYFNLEVVTEYMRTIMLYVSMSDASLDMLKIRNESHLNEGRKTFNKVLQLLEEVVGSDVDRSLNDNVEYLQRIEKVTPDKILQIVRNVNTVFNTLVERMSGSKWKWAFVETYGRVAVITKNLINFTDIQKYRDPRSDFYRDRQELLHLCKNSLKEAAQQYRTKYEQSTKVPGDILKSIELLVVLRKSHVLFGETEEASKMKNTIDALKQRLEAEEKEQEKEKEKKKKKS